MCCGLKDFILSVHFAASSVTWVDFSDYKGEPWDFWYIDFFPRILLPHVFSMKYQEGILLE